MIDGVRIPLGFRIASIPAFGRLAAIAKKRYGKRADNSRQARHELFQERQGLLPENVHFKIDGHTQFPILIEKYFPKGSYSVHVEKYRYKRYIYCLPAVIWLQPNGVPQPRSDEI